MSTNEFVVGIQRGCITSCTADMCKAQLDIALHFLGVILSS